jgi:hypothetical protein
MFRQFFNISLKMRHFKKACPLCMQLGLVSLSLWGFAWSLENFWETHDFGGFRGSVVG